MIAFLQFIWCVSAFIVFTGVFVIVACELRIFCNDGTDIAFARDKIICMTMHKKIADGGVEYYELEILTNHTTVGRFQSNPALRELDNYLTSEILWSIYNEFVEGE